MKCICVVWFPYEITLLSNTITTANAVMQFDSPMKLHYSQTSTTASSANILFDSPMKLHYSQTFPSHIRRCGKFDSPMKLHYSQTKCPLLIPKKLFDSPMKLHYSQTQKAIGERGTGLIPLWNYTTLKPSRLRRFWGICLIPLWNYTTLKPQTSNLNQNSNKQLTKLRSSMFLGTKHLNQYLYYIIIILH